MLFIRVDIPSKLAPNVNPSGKLENTFSEMANSYLEKLCAP